MDAPGVVAAGGVTVAGGGVAGAGGGVADAGGGVAVLGREVWVLLGLLIAPGVVPVPVLLSGGQLALATAPEEDIACPVWLAVPAVPVPSTQGLTSGTEPGVAAAPDVAVPGPVVGVPDCIPVLVPRVPGWLPVCEPAPAPLCT